MSAGDVDVQASIYSGAYGSAQHNTCCTRLTIKRNKFINLISGHNYN